VDNSTTNTNGNSGKNVEHAQEGTQGFLSASSGNIYYRTDDNRDTSRREIMTDEQDESDNRPEQSPKPLLTGDRMLDKALEKLRRTLEAKKEATKQSTPASGRAEHG
jgi:hypothetical protein